MSPSPSILESDPHDAQRLEHVHPPHHRNPEPASRYNLVVVGAGSGGLISALVASSLGARVALVERDLMGGDCLNVGCVPSKALIRSARIAGEVRRARDLGLPLPEGAGIDFGAAMERVRAVRAAISEEDSVARYAGEFGIDVFLGHGRFAAPDVLEVSGPAGEARLRFRKAIIATGGRPVAPPIEGLAEAGFLTNETVFNLTRLPARLAVIGGGPIGCELSQAFRRLGSDVTLLEQAPHFLSREDPDASSLLERVFRREGVRLELGVQVLRVERKGADRVVHYRGADGSHAERAVDEILVGAGRAPNVEGLGLEAAGVESDPRAGVRVDERLRTSNPKIFAVGDVAMSWKFTHAADAAAKLAVRNAFFFGRGRVSDLVMPWCTYTAPEIAHVGLYPRDAEKRGIDIDTYEVPLAEVNRAVTDGEEEGFVKIHTKRGRDTIVGATIVAPHAGEWVSQVTQAMVAGVGLAKLADVIFPYPTQAEALKRAGGQLLRGRLTPRVKRLFEAWFRWQR